KAPYTDQIAAEEPNEHVCQDPRRTYRQRRRQNSRYRRPRDSLRHQQAEVASRPDMPQPDQPAQFVPEVIAHALGGKLHVYRIRKKLNTISLLGDASAQF